MTQQIINTGTVPDDATGDPAKVAFDKINANFTEVYGASVVGYNPASFNPASALTGAEQVALIQGGVNALTTAGAIAGLNSAAISSAASLAAAATAATTATSAALVTTNANVALNAANLVATNANLAATNTALATTNTNLAIVNTSTAASIGTLNTEVAGLLAGSGAFIPGVTTLTALLAAFPAGANGGRSAQTTDFGLVTSDGTRWLVVGTPPQPPGAALLGFNKNAYTVIPSLAEVAFTNTLARIYSGATIFGPSSPPSGNYATSANGQLQLIFPNGGPNSQGATFTTERNVFSALVPASLGVLPFLLAGQGFYFEIAVTLNSNNTDNFFACFLEPQEHNSIQSDRIPTDPVGYERWLEFDVIENGHGTDLGGNFRGAFHTWQGFFAGACVFTAPLTGSGGTLSTVAGAGGGWPGDSTTFPLTTSTGQALTATFINGSNAVTWTPAIIGTPTATATAKYRNGEVSNIDVTALDYTVEHIFGMSFDPIGQTCSWWQDGVLKSTHSAAGPLSPVSPVYNAGTLNWHYFPIIWVQSHGTFQPFTANIRYFSAWTP